MDAVFSRYPSRLRGPLAVDETVSSAPSCGRPPGVAYDWGQDGAAALAARLRGEMWPIADNPAQLAGVWEGGGGGWGGGGGGGGGVGGGGGGGGGFRELLPLARPQAVLDHGRRPDLLQCGPDIVDGYVGHGCGSGCSAVRGDESFPAASRTTE